MNRLTIGKRIVLGFAILTIIVAAVGGLGFLGLKNTITEAQSITQQTKDHGRFLADSINLARSTQLDFKKQVQEWKDTLLRGNDPESFKKYSDQFDQRGAAVDQDLQSLQTLFSGAGVDTKLVDQSLAEHQKLVAQYHEALKSYEPTNAASCFVVDKLVKGIDRPATDAIDAIVTQVQQFEADTTKATEEQFRQQTVHIQMWVLLGLAIGVVFAVVFGWTLIQSLTRQLFALADSLGASSREVAAAASQVSVTSQSLAEGSSSQAASIEQTSASLEELSSMTKRNADNSRQANELSKQTRMAADKGVVDMQGMNTAMLAIKDSSDDIAKIIKTIDEIAFQTNILALNAAVEAARAGEAGMGFAVVADEVRNLAQRSAQAAKETAAKIEGAIHKTAQGVEYSDKVSQALNDIVTKARQVDELAAEVAGASTEQTHGITQINTAVVQMDRVTQSNAASSEESAAAAEELYAQAETMKKSVADLLRLVAGDGQASQAKEAGFVRTPKATRPVVPTGKGAGASKGNGQHQGKPAGRKSEIPMDASFKDF
jgi:methyl-accepting chemotaxis protein